MSLERPRMSEARGSQGPVGAQVDQMAQNPTAERASVPAPLPDTRKAPRVVGWKKPVAVLLAIAGLGGAAKVGADAMNSQNQGGIGPEPSPSPTLVGETLLPSESPVILPSSSAPSLEPTPSSEVTASPTPSPELTPTPEPTPEPPSLESIKNAWLTEELKADQENMFVNDTNEPLPFEFIVSGEDFKSYRALFLGAEKLDNGEVIALFGFHDSKGEPLAVAMRLGTTVPGSPVFVHTSQSRNHNYDVDRGKDLQTSGSSFFDTQDQYRNRATYFSIYEVQLDSDPWPGLKDAFNEGFQPAKELGKYMKEVKNKPWRAAGERPSFVLTEPSHPLPQNHENIPFLSELTFRALE